MAIVHSMTPSLSVPGYLMRMFCNEPSRTEGLQEPDDHDDDDDTFKIRLILASIGT
jgi:hypothetical protein